MSGCLCGTCRPPWGAGTQRAAERGGTPRPSCPCRPRRRGRPSRLRPDPRPGAGGTCPAGPGRSALPLLLPGPPPSSSRPERGQPGLAALALVPVGHSGPALPVQAGGAAGGRGRSAGPGSLRAAGVAVRSLGVLPCPFTAGEAPCCSAAASSVRGRLLASLVSWSSILVIF